MALTYNFPGVYAEIKDLSQVVNANSTTVCAYVGESEFGPVFKPTLVSNLKTYVEKFGQLNSKYGYMGYSVAVASETINNHYIVRVVNKDTAKYSAIKVAKDTGSHQTFTTGYNYATIEAAKKDSMTLFTSEVEGQTVIDQNNCMIIVAENPNNKVLKVTIEDTTINTNKQFTAGTTSVTAGVVTGTYDISFIVPANYSEEGSASSRVETGDTIEVTNASNAKCNGYFTATVTQTEGVTSIKYTVTSDEAISSVSGIKFVKYPDDDETTFSIKVSETVNKVTTEVERFQYCTLYSNKDNYGNSTFVEDVVNGNSDYIQIFANTTMVTASTIIPEDLTNSTLEGGTPGSTPTIADLLAGWEEFRDRSQTAVTILMNSGYASNDNYSYQSKMLEIAEARRDCFCLFDVPSTKTKAEDAKDWRKNIQGFTTYRGAISSPWIKTYDSVSGKSNFLMCPSAYIAKIMGTNNPWIAPAGLNRGILSSSTVSPTGLTTYYDDTQGGVLYDNQINCIIKNPGAGYVNWGQKTLQQKPSALDRINVARTVIFIETTLRDAAKYHLFENNTAFNRMQITLQFNQFLDTVLTADGLTSYQVICDESNNTPQVIANNQLAIDVYLWPVYCDEFIKLTTIVMGAGATVTTSTSAA